MPQQSQSVQGPDGRLYQFPSGTTKEQAIAYFKSKGIGQGQVTPYVYTGGQPQAGAFTPRRPQGSATGRFFSGIGSSTMDIGRGVLRYPLTIAESLDANNTARAINELEKSMQGMTSEQKQEYLKNNLWRQIGLSLPGEQGIVDREAKGDVSGAIGYSIPNALMIALGLRSGIRKSLPEGTLRRSINMEQRLNKITRVLGEGEPKTAFHIERAIGDMAETVRDTGVEPSTPKQLLENVEESKRQINNTLAPYEQRVAGEQFMPTPVIERLRKMADEMSTEREGEAEALRAYSAKEWEHPLTFRDLRRRLDEHNAIAAGEYEKATPEQLAGQRKGTTPAQSKIIADELRNLLYDDILDKRFKGRNFRDLRQRLGSLIEISRILQERVPELHTAQRYAKGAPLSQRISATIYGGIHGMRPGVRPLVHAGKGIFSRGPERIAEIETRKAFSGLGKADLGRYAVKARADGNLAIASVLDDMANRTPEQKAKDVVRHIDHEEKPVDKAIYRSARVADIRKQLNETTDPKEREQLRKQLEHLQEE